MTSRVVPFAGLDWRWLLVPPVALLLYWNFAGVAYTVGAMNRFGEIGDWHYWGQVDPVNPYAWEWVRWSPPAVWLWTTLNPFGWVMIAAHFAVLAFLRPWWVIPVVLLFWPFWEDTLAGTDLTFAFVSAWTALNGSRIGGAAFVIHSAFIPRPLMLPVLAYLLVKRPEMRWWFAGAVLFVLGYSLAVGQLDDWALRMIDNAKVSSLANLSPSAWIGWWWIPIGLALSVWFTVKGRFGLASLAISPYIGMYYLMMGLLELRQVKLNSGKVKPSSHASTLAIDDGNGRADSSRPIVS